MGRPPSIHNLDGYCMTCAEAAQRLGVTENALKLYCSKHDMTVQQAADALRANLWRPNNSGHRVSRLTQINGRYFTVKELAERAHVSKSTFFAYMRSNGATPKQTFDHFVAHPITGNGPAPVLHDLDGEKVTIREAAERLATTRATLNKMRSALNLSLQEVADLLRARRQRRAEAAILKIITTAARRERHAKAD